MSSFEQSYWPEWTDWTFRAITIVCSASMSRPRDANKSQGSAPQSKERCLSASDARENLAELVNQVAYGSQRVVIARRGRAIAALIPIEDLRKLELLEKKGRDESDRTERRNDVKLTSNGL